MKPLSILFLILTSLGLSAAVAIAEHGAMPMNSSTPSPLAQGQPAPANRPLSVAAQQYQEVIQRTVGMVSNPQAQELARGVGLNILDLTWEDTGRYYNSAVGPNISDMTIQVQYRDPATDEYRLYLMPVIRHPNFADETADVPLDRFFLLVGNERGQALRRVSLREFLGNLRQYLHQPESWQGQRTSLLADRDTHVLVSAQSCFLPVPQGGIAQFNPVLFNYQSYPGNPAVLTILASREGTSVTIIDNERDAFEAGNTWGQRLFFNQNGERASLTGQRLSDFQPASGGDRPTPSSPTAAGETGLNMVMLIQVPLVYQERIPRSGGGVQFAMPLEAGSLSTGSDVEAAVIGHGDIEGPFTEIDNLAIERDPRFPIRVTVQFYKATSNGVVTEADIRQIHQQISRVYADGDYVGSLVVDGASDRPTDYDGNHQQPTNWWEQFWERYQRETGRSPGDVRDLLRWLRGEGINPPQ